MERVKFVTNINAPKEKVWKTLWEDSTYRKWTSVFSESSHAETDWKEGSKVLFVDDKGSGMVSRIEASKPGDFMSFQHLGIVKDGVEDTQSEEVKSFAGAFENYQLNDIGGATELIVETDIAENFKDFFLKTFPKALEQVKVLSEQ